jgi:hypothetical protein
MLTEKQLNKLSTRRLVALLRSIRSRIIGVKKTFNERLDAAELRIFNQYFNRVKKILSEREHVGKKNEQSRKMASRMSKEEKV